MEELNASAVYSIIIDETCDITMREQLIIYAKYLNGSFTPQTRFIGIVQVSSDSRLKLNLGFLLDCF